MGKIKTSKKLQRALNDGVDAMMLINADVGVIFNPDDGDEADASAAFGNGVEWALGVRGQPIWAVYFNDLGNTAYFAGTEAQVLAQIKKAKAAAPWGAGGRGRDDGAPGGKRRARGDLADAVKKLTR